MSAPNMISSVTPGSSSDVCMHDASSEDKVKDVVQRKLGVSRAITKRAITPKPARPKVSPAAAAPSQRPPQRSTAPQPVGISVRDEDDEDIIIGLGGLRV